MSYSLDIETFISEVKKYPAIWDHYSDEYRYRVNKLEALAKVARVFIPDFDGMSDTDKEEVYKKLFAKWRTIRDSYCRHIKNKHSTGRGYFYARYLTFLNKNYKHRSYGIDTNHSEEESDDEKKVEKLKKIGFVKSGSKDRQYLEVSNDWQCDETEASTSEKQNQSDEPIARPNIEYDAHTMMPDVTTSFPVDEDRSFFESLLPAVRDFDIDKKLEFRCGVLKLLKSLRTNHNNKQRKRTKRDTIDDDDEDYFS